MKIVNTQFRTEELLTWDEIKELITTGIYEEDFIVLFDKKSKNIVGEYQGMRFHDWDDLATYNIAKKAKEYLESLPKKEDSE